MLTLLHSNKTEWATEDPKLAVTDSEYSSKSTLGILDSTPHPGVGYTLFSAGQSASEPHDQKANNIPQCTVLRS